MIETLSFIAKYSVQMHKFYFMFLLILLCPSESVASYSQFLKGQ